MPVEVQFGTLDATEIRDLQSNDFHALACLFYEEPSAYWCSLWRFLLLSFNCHILRSICLLEGDELAAKYC